MRVSICAALALAVAATGCAAPNTPGRGSGEHYTPVIDMQGLDMARYQSDLASCRQYARTINPTGQVIAGAIAGALLGAAIGSAAGSGTRWQGNLTRGTAAYGASYGSLHGGGRAVAKQETIIANCMAGRGYRTLDATVPVNYRAASPYADAATVPAITLPAQQPQPPVIAQAEVGVDSFNAARLAKDQQCAAAPAVRLTGKGPGFETYSVACDSGDVWTLRCEYGACRTLQ